MRCGVSFDGVKPNKQAASRRPEMWTPDPTEVSTPSGTVCRVSGNYGGVGEWCFSTQVKTASLALARPRDLARAEDERVTMLETQMDLAASCAPRSASHEARGAAPGTPLGA